MTEVLAVTAPGPLGPGAPVVPPGVRLIPLFREPCHRTGLKPQRNGYVRRRYRGRHWLVHRIAWTEQHGEIPPGVKVLHHCDVRWCDEITHLYLGTAADNARDRDQRGRTGRQPGVVNPSAKLNPDIVRVLRAARGTVTGVDLAARYGVTPSVVSEAQRGITWRDVV